jgi:hypothetical protein
MEPLLTLEPIKTKHQTGATNGSWSWC